MCNVIGKERKNVYVLSIYVKYGENNNSNNAKIAINEGSTMYTIDKHNEICLYDVIIHSNYICSLNILQHVPFMLLLIEMIYASF